jgi:hypothetical protein
MFDVKNGKDIVRCDRCHKDLTLFCAKVIHMKGGVHVGDECIGKAYSVLHDDNKSIETRRSILHNEYLAELREATLRGMHGKSAPVEVQLFDTPTEQDMSDEALLLANNL